MVRFSVCLFGCFNIQLLLIVLISSVLFRSHSFRCVQDEHRDPLQRGYSRVDTAEGSLSNSSTATSLDTVLIDSATTELAPLPRSQPLSRPTPFNPILESEESTSVRNVNEKQSSLRRGDTALRTALKSSKVSFEQPADHDHEESDEDSFEERREHFQQKKAKSADHRGILKVCDGFACDLTVRSNDLITRSISLSGLPHKHTGPESPHRRRRSQSISVQEARVAGHQTLKNPRENPARQLIGRGVRRVPGSPETVSVAQAQELGRSRQIQLGQGQASGHVQQ